MNESTSAVPSRREFGLAIAGIGAVSTVPSLGEEPKKDPPKLPDIKDLTASLETVLRHRFGKILDDVQIKKVLTSLMRGRNTGDVLGRVKVTNADEPGYVFSADV